MKQFHTDTKLINPEGPVRESEGNKTRQKAKGVIHYEEVGEIWQGAAALYHTV